MAGATPPPDSGLWQLSFRGATGVQLPTGVPFAGFLSAGKFGGGGSVCSVTVVSDFMAITAAHCSTHEQTLKLNVASLSEPGHVHAVKEFRRHPTLDVKAIFLRERTGLTVTPLREAVTPDVFYTWATAATYRTVPPDS